MAQSTTEFVERTDADQAPPGPARISGGHLVAKALKAEGVDTIFTLCGGFSGGVVQPKSPGHWMDPGPLGTLGVGMPSSMAAKLARPKKEVVTCSAMARSASPDGTSRPWSASTFPSSAPSATTH